MKAGLSFKRERKWWSRGASNFLCAAGRRGDCREVSGAICGLGKPYHTTCARVLTFAPGDTMVMDNLDSHKGAGVRKAIEEAGAKLLYLPPYSLDGNPIEKASSKLKACDLIWTKTTAAYSHMRHCGPDPRREHSSRRVATVFSKA